MPQEVFVTVIIRPDHHADQIQPFFEGNLHINPAVRFYYLIFADGQQHDTDWPDQYTPKLVWCCSITGEFVWNLREVCAKANALNIEYCGRRVRQFRRAGQMNNVFSYLGKQQQLVHLQRIYIEELERSLG
jgi:hypothetical protein